MKKITITTPENIDVEYTLADAASRTAATIIDSLIQFAFIVVLVIANYIIAMYAPGFWERQYGWIIGISLLVYAVLSYGYFIFAELVMNGRTPGKRLLRLRVIRRNGQPLTLRHAAIRNLFKVLIDSFGLGIIFMFFSKERRRLGDYAASTIVVIDEERMRPASLESLHKLNEHFSYYLSKDETELLRDYLERRPGLSPDAPIHEKMENYFRKRFKAAGANIEWDGI